MKCINCKSSSIYKIIEFNAIPISNNFTHNSKINGTATYPLGLVLCKNCKLVQNSKIIQNKKIFNHKYLYHSSFSSSWLKHSEILAKYCIKKFKLGNKSTVLEIASNDGYLLQFFKKKKINTIGIEPSQSVAKIAMGKGIKTYINFLSTSFVRKKKIKSNLILGLNVLAHTPNIRDFIKSLELLMSKNSTCILEFPYLPNLIKKCQVDTIYHEHYSYLSFLSLRNLFRSSKIDIYDYKFIKTHGGSVRVFLKKKFQINKNQKLKIDKIINHEKKIGIDKIEFYKNFSKKVKKILDMNSKKITKLSLKNKICGYGAAAKSTIICNLMKIKNKNIDFVYDKNYHKQNKFIPNTGIQIKSPDNIIKDKPDYLIVFPWNLENEIKKEFSYTRKWGCKFLKINPYLKEIK